MGSAVSPGNSLSYPGSDSVWHGIVDKLAVMTHPASEAALLHLMVTEGQQSAETTYPLCLT
jgi:hypothetical protein